MNLRPALSSLVSLAAAALLSVGCQEAIVRTSGIPANFAADSATVDRKDLEARYPDREAVCLEYFHEAEHLAQETIHGTDGLGVGPLELNWWLYQTYIQKYLIFKPESRFSEFQAYVPREALLKQAILWIEAPDGSRKQFGPSDLTRETDSDGDTTYKFAFPQVSKGSIIGYAYSISRRVRAESIPVYYESRLHMDIPCEKLTFKYTYPSWWNLQVKRLGPDTPLPLQIRKNESNKQITLTYAAEHVPEVVSEPFSPFIKELYPYAKIHIMRMDMMAGGRIVRYTAPKTWKEAGAKFNEFYNEKEPIISSLVEDTTKQVTADCKTDYEKLVAIVNWLHDTMQIVYEQGDFADNIFAHKGSDFQVNGLGRRMLLWAGIPCKTLLLHPAQAGYFDPAYVSTHDMVTPAVLADVQGQSYLVFPALKNIPVGHVPDEFQGQPALVINGERDAEILTLPTGNRVHNEISAVFTLNVQEDGKVQANEERTYVGSNAYDMRKRLVGLDQAGIEKLLKQELVFSQFKLDLTKAEFADRYDYRKPLKLSLAYAVDDLVALSPGEAIFNAGELLTPASGLPYRLQPKERKNAIRIYNDTVLTKSVTLNLPIKWELASPLADAKVENSFGAISSTCKPGPGTLEIQQTLTLKKSAEPKERAADLYALAGRKSAISVPTLVFKVKP